jgi:hypothetical protein
MLVALVAAVPSILFTVYGDVVVDAVCTDDFTKVPFGPHFKKRLQG